MASNGADDKTGSAKDYTVPLVINGRDITNSATFPVISPATGKQLWTCSSASKSDALSAVKAAEAALPAWRGTKSQKRREIFLKAADILERRGDEGCRLMAEETAALEPFCKFNLDVTVEQIRDVAARITGSLAGSVPECMSDGTSALILKEPFGVVFSMTPW